MKLFGTLILPVKERQINRMSETMSRVMVFEKAGIYIAAEWPDCNANILIDGLISALLQLRNLQQ